MGASTDITGKIHTMPGNEEYRKRFDAIDWKSEQVGRCEVCGMPIYNSAPNIKGNMNKHMCSCRYEENNNGNK